MIDWLIDIRIDYRNTAILFQTTGILPLLKLYSIIIALDYGLQNSTECVTVYYNSLVVKGGFTSPFWLCGGWCIPRQGPQRSWQPRPAHCTRVGWQGSPHSQDTECHSHRVAVGHCGGDVKEECEGVYMCAWCEGSGVHVIGEVCAWGECWGSRVISEGRWQREWCAAAWCMKEQWDCLLKWEAVNTMKRCWVESNWATEVHLDHKNRHRLTHSHLGPACGVGLGGMYNYSI